MIDLRAIGIFFGLRQPVRILFLILAAGLLLSAPARGDEPEDEALPTESQREAMYRELNRDVDALQRQLGILKRVIQLARPSVVHIEATKANTVGFSRAMVQEAGSGVIVRIGEGLFVLTNRHVIRQSQPQNVKIRLADGRVIHPRKVWSDSGTDIAVMEIDAPRLVAAKLGDSNSLEIGDFVLAVGSPFGLSHSVSYGIVSAMGRRDLELGDEGVKYQNFVQTDAAINPGNSGGPLLNLRGEVVGLNTAIASASGGNEGIGFSIPINTVNIIARQLVERGAVSRAFLGVNLDSKFTPAIAAALGLPRALGARVTGVTPGSPAENAKLQSGDIVIEFNGVRIENDSHLVNLVGLTEVGKEVPIVIYRDKAVHRLKVMVGDRGKFDPGS